MKPDKQPPVLCECNGMDCTRSMLVPVEVVMKIHASGGCLIHPDCDTVPTEGDRFVGQTPAYQVWTNGERGG